MEKLTTLKGLNYGDKVTKISFDGYQIFEFLCFDSKDDRYGYFLDSFGRTKVERWYEGWISEYNVFKGYDRDFVYNKEIELMNNRIEGLKKLMEDGN